MSGRFDLSRLGLIRFRGDVPKGGAYRQRRASSRKVKDLPPVYAGIAQAGHVHGVVILETTIARDGKVQDAKVLRSIPELDQAAHANIRQVNFSGASSFWREVAGPHSELVSRNRATGAAVYCLARARSPRPTAAKCRSRSDRFSSLETPVAAVVSRSLSAACVRLARRRVRDEGSSRAPGFVRVATCCEGFSIRKSRTPQVFARVGFGALLKPTAIREP